MLFAADRETILCTLGVVIVAAIALLLIWLQHLTRKRGDEGVKELVEDVAATGRLIDGMKLDEVAARAAALDEVAAREAAPYIDQNAKKTRRHQWDLLREFLYLPKSGENNDLSAGEVDLAARFYVEQCGNLMHHSVSEHALMLAVEEGVDWPRPDLGQRTIFRTAHVAYRSSFLLAVIRRANAKKVRDCMQLVLMNGETTPELAQRHINNLLLNDIIKRRSTKPSWSTEAAEDLRSQHGIDT